MGLQTTIYITPRQRKGLFARARKRKTSFSEELRSAVDFYLDQPADLNPKELEMLAREVKTSAERSAAQLDAMTVRVNQTAQRLEQFQRKIDGLK